MAVAISRVTPAVMQRLPDTGSGTAVCRFIYFCSISCFMAASAASRQSGWDGVVLALIVCRVIPLNWVRAGARWLLAEMLLFFVPAVVAVVNYAQLLLMDGWRIFAVIAISTLMVLGATAWVVDNVYRYEMSRVNRE